LSTIKLWVALLGILWYSSTLDIQPKAEWKFDEADIKCLADNIYHEARGEGEKGMLAVAYVTVNRFNHHKWPKSICGVVYQKSQFSWTLKRQKPVPTAGDHYEVAYKVLYDSNYKNNDFTQGSLWYHSIRVAPKWAQCGSGIRFVNRHVFYQETKCQQLTKQQRTQSLQQMGATKVTRKSTG
jgi:N-acetylmuramoyl-L-alanine amidase